MMGYHYPNKSSIVKPAFHTQSTLMYQSYPHIFHSQKGVTGVLTCFRSTKIITQPLLIGFNPTEKL